jgi:hypothetical protein
MAEPTITESSTFPANEYLDDFFSDKPTDLRFTKTHYKKFSPITQHDKTGRIFEFSLPAQKAPYVYIFEDTYMSARVSIRKKMENFRISFCRPPNQEKDQWQTTSDQSIAQFQASSKTFKHSSMTTKLKFQTITNIDHFLMIF